MMGDSVLPQFAARRRGDWSNQSRGRGAIDAAAVAEIDSILAGNRLLLAIGFGTMAGAVVAGVAMLASHS
jgi:hypothetical protein